MNLIVPVIPKLSLRAGAVTSQGDRLIITPPAQTLFDQLCAWLDQCPPPTAGFNHWVLSIGATGLCLRWGSYLAVLLDESKPVAPHARQSTGSASMISDDEMCRINIEAASNLARLLQLWQTDEDAFFRLLRTAYTWLPMPQRRLPRHQASLDTLLRALSIPPESSENLHAGKTPVYPLDKRRVTSREAGKIVRFTAERLGRSLLPCLSGTNRYKRCCPGRKGSAVLWPHATILGIGHSRKLAHLSNCSRPGRSEKHDPWFLTGQGQ